METLKEPSSRPDALQLLSLAESFEPLLSKSLNGFLSVDIATGVIVYASPSMCNLLGWTRKAMEGKRQDAFTHDLDKLRLNVMLDELRRTGETTSQSASCVIRYLCRDGEFKALEMRASSDGTFLFQVLFDATEPHQMEQKLRDYMLCTSHDLRTPCVSISASATLLAQIPDVADSPEAAVTLGNLRASCNVLMCVINNVLTLKQLQMGQPVKVHSKVFKLEEAVDEALRSVAYTSSLTVTTLWHTAAPQFVRGDAEHLMAALCDMRLTAVRLGTWCAPKEPALLDLSCCMMDDDTVLFKANLLVSSRALNAAEADALLAPFGCAPVDMGAVSGLSLYICREYAEALGGKLTLEEGRSEGVHIMLSVPFQIGVGANLEADEPMPLCLLPPPPPRVRQSSAMSEDPSEDPADVGPLQGDPRITQRMFEHLVEASEDSFVVCKVTGPPDLPQLLIEYCSPNAACRTCVMPEEMLGRNMLSMCFEGDVAMVIAAVVQALAGNGQLMVTHRNLTAHGTIIWCDTSGYTDGVRFYLVCRDVRARREKESSLRRFMVSTSASLHEPANALLLSAAWLAERPCILANAEALFFLSAIRAACRFLLGIINNVVTADEVDSPHLQSTMVIFSPGLLIDDMVKTCRLGSAVPGGVEWERNASDNLPPLVEADEQRIAQCMQNLITNGLKFSGKAVIVRASMRDVDQGVGTLRISVTDAGRGLSDSEKLSCFNAYAKAAPERGGGTGLGLFISQAFAKLMGGSLRVDSKLGEGATFTLAVPVRILTDEEVASTSAVSGELSFASKAMDASTGQVPPLSGRKRVTSDVAAGVQCYRCLLADDHRLNVMLMSRLLTLNGFEVTTAEDGLQALEALKSGKVFDLAILDMEMPHLTGPEVCVAFRSYEAERGVVRLPIVSLTANVLQEHADLCFASGMDAFMTKPLSSQALLQLRATAKHHAAERAARKAAKGEGDGDGHMQEE